MKYLLIFLSFSFLLYCQTQNPEWRNFTYSDMIHSITEENNFLWLSTSGGLVKFNKLTNQTEFFNKGNSLLPSNNIYSAVVDHEGYKWICTYAGIVKFRDADWYVYNSENSGLPYNPYTSLVIDSADVIWIGTNDSGLVRFDGSSWTIYNTANSSLPSNRIRSLLYKNNTLYIGTFSGVAKKTNSGFETFSATAGKIIHSMDLDVQNYIWFSTKNGIYKISGENVQQFYNYNVSFIKVDEHNVKWGGVNQDLPDIHKVIKIDSADQGINFDNTINNMLNYPWFYSMYNDDQGTKWFGSVVGLLKVDQSGTGTHIHTSNSKLGISNLPKIFIDRNDREWFFCWGSIPLSTTVLPPGYLSVYDNNNWQMFTQENSPVTIGGVRAAANGWNSYDMYFALSDIGGSSSLYKYSASVWTLISVPPTQYNTILYMWFDETANEMWVDFEGANGQNNVFRYNGFDWTPVPGYPVYDINKIVRRGSTLWFASPQGLIKKEGALYTLYNTSNSGIPHNYVTALDFDSYGNLWMSTQAGMAKFDGNAWTVYNRYNSPLTCDDLTGIVVDGNDNVYTANSFFSGNSALGLIRFNGVNWRFYTNANSGKPDTYCWFGEIMPYFGSTLDGVNDIAIDDSGKIWIANDVSIGVYDKNGIPVPAEIISFSASVLGTTVRLKWSTASETNNRGFEIQKSPGNNIWTTIGFTEGNGTTTETRFYQYEDKNAAGGSYKYRVKQVDYDGSFTFSNEIAVEIGTVNKFALYQNYPNPFNPETKIKYEVCAAGKVQLKIFDILGKEIAELVNETREPGLYDVSFNASWLSSGIYFYTLRAGDFYQVRKLMLVK